MMQLFYEKATVEELKEIRYFISGGAPLPRTLAENFYRKFSIPVQEGYGLSEASPVVTVNPASKIKIGSIGPALPAVRIKIVDENSNPLPPTKVGELCVQGNNVMLGYLNLPEETAHTLRDGWLHTGDMVYSDEEGYLYLVDRLKDMIISSGENIYPREVEEVIYAYPGVEEAAVIGIPDKLRGEAVCAYLVPKAGVTLEKQALRKYLLEHVAPYKVPRKFYFCTELPKSGTGKILKKVLREQATVNAISR
jgi:long-chain acyl-CoA synthetase